MKSSILETYLLVRCEESCPKLSNLICWLRWRFNVAISWRKLGCPLFRCKLTSRFTERKMLHEGKSELPFDQVIEVDSTKKVAALAFVSPCIIASYRADDQYNCLSTLSCPETLVSIADSQLSPPRRSSPSPNPLHGNPSHSSSASKSEQRPIESSSQVVLYMVPSSSFKILLSVVISFPHNSSISLHRHHHCSQHRIISMLFHFIITCSLMAYFMYVCVQPTISTAPPRRYVLTDYSIL
jgi:hypothetical protein